MIPRDEDSSIWKFPLEMTDEQTLMIPEVHELLCVQVQTVYNFSTPARQVPTIWALVQTDSARVPRKVYVVGTGHKMPVAAVDYLGTFQMGDGRLVFHVFTE